MSRATRASSAIHQPPRKTPASSSTPATAGTTSIVSAPNPRLFHGSRCTRRSDMVIVPGAARTRRRPKRSIPTIDCSQASRPPRIAKMGLTCELVS